MTLQNLRVGCGSYVTARAVRWKGELIVRQPLRLLLLAASLALGAALFFGTSTTARADYGDQAVYQVEISTNPPGFGVWFWAGARPGRDERRLPEHGLHPPRARRPQRRRAQFRHRQRLGDLPKRRRSDHARCAGDRRPRDRRHFRSRSVRWVWALEFGHVHSGERTAADRRDLPGAGTAGALTDSEGQS